MAYDRFVCFQQEIPTQEQLKLILEDYLGELGKIDYQEDRWYVILPGKPSYPFKRIAHYSTYQEILHEERWFEIYVDSINQDKDEGMGPNIDVITRLADELTNNVASGFAKAVARYFRAKSDLEFTL